jgi:hypothetical protein
MGWGRQVARAWQDRRGRVRVPRCPSCCLFSHSLSVPAQNRRTHDLHCPPFTSAMDAQHAALKGRERILQSFPDLVGPTSSSKTHTKLHSLMDNCLSSFLPGWLTKAHFGTGLLLGRGANSSPKNLQNTPGELLSFAQRYVPLLLPFVSPRRRPLSLPKHVLFLPIPAHLSAILSPSIYLRSGALTDRSLDYLAILQVTRCPLPLPPLRPLRRKVPFVYALHGF